MFLKPGCNFDKVKILPLNFHYKSISFLLVEVQIKPVDKKEANGGCESGPFIAVVKGVVLNIESG